LPDDADGVLARLVTGIARLAAAPLPEPWALVGGIAVMARLVDAHRVTRDVDAVADTGTGDASALITAVAADLGGLRLGENGLQLDDGTKVDVIATGTWTEDDLPDDPIERLMILAHWWAATDAAPLELRVVRGRRAVATADVPVATPAALVATKLHAMRSRRRAPEKTASDAYDTYRLLGAHDRDGSLSDAVADGPDDLAALCVDGMSETFVDGATRWARRIKTSLGGAATSAIDAEDLALAGRLFCDRVRRGLS
jgi:hypothetical protein